MTKMFPVIDPVATGENILRLRKSRGLTVRDLQLWFGFEEPQAIYKWQKGRSLPSVDNLYALGVLLDVPIEEILVPGTPQLKMIHNGQQDQSCCPIFMPGSLEYGRMKSPCSQLFRHPSFAALLPKGACAAQGRTGECPEANIPFILMAKARKAGVHADGVYVLGSVR